MTWRYPAVDGGQVLLIIGRMPEEMKQLFDYDPIIEIDMSDPCGQFGGARTGTELHAPDREKFSSTCRKMNSGQTGSNDAARLEDFERPIKRSFLLIDQSR